MNRCRCGHGRQWHRRASGVKRLPCQFLARSGPRFPTGAPSGPVTKCKCRDWHPEPEVVLFDREGFRR